MEENVQQAVERLGRKFEDRDVTAHLAVEARNWARAYVGDFEYMNEMQAKANTSRSMRVGEIRGVLNCMRADLLRAVAEAAPTVADPDSLGHIHQLFATARENGLKYPKIELAVTGPGDTIRVLVISIAGAQSSRPGAINVAGPGRFGDRDYFGAISTDGRWCARQPAPEWVTDLLAAFAADPAGMAASSGLLTGDCSFCHKRLTDEKSTDVGYGPVCARNWHLPWGGSMKRTA